MGNTRLGDLTDRPACFEALSGSSLGATSNENAAGPELGFGYMTRDYHNVQVLFITTVMGKRVLIQLLTQSENDSFH